MSRRRSRATSTTETRGPAVATRLELVGGKGGVGKTTCAAALGLLHASRGHRTLVLSTDPAPSLGDAFRRPLSDAPRPVPGPSSLLHAAEVDAGTAMRRWLRRRRPVLASIALRGTWLDEQDVAVLLREALPGMDEIAALFEILHAMRSGRYDLVVLDTAPTGHTLRMLELPNLIGVLARVFDDMQERHRAVVTAFRGRRSPDAADALIAGLAADATELHAVLRDPLRMRLTWVAEPETLAVEETLDAVAALSRLGIPVHAVLMNRLTPPPPEPCGWCRARRGHEARVVGGLRRKLARVLEGRHRPQLVEIDAFDTEPVGVRALRQFSAALEKPAARVRPPRARAPAPQPVYSTIGPGRSSDVLPDGVRLLMFGGKGGVGKTTCAAAAALEMAQHGPGRRVLLLSVDPAHSLADVLRQPLSDAPHVVGRNLVARELDARRAIDRLRRQHAASIDRLFDRLAERTYDSAHDRRLLQDLLALAPPGLDEIATVLDALDRRMHGADSEYDLIVMDTAPTGHALRLLQMPSLLHRWVHMLMRILLKYQSLVGAGELGESLLSLSKGLGRLRTMLADPGQTAFVVVTRAAALPAAETRRLIAELRRRHLAVPSVVVNAVGAGSCSRCRRTAALQRRAIAALRRSLGPLDLVLAPAASPPPRGSAALRRWRGRWQPA